MAHVYPFVAPPLSSIPGEQRVYELAMDAGDLEYAGWGLHNMVCYGFYGGMPLSELTRLCDENLKTLSYHRQAAAIDCTVQFSQLVRALTSGSIDSPSLTDEEYDEQEHGRALEAAGLRGGRFILTVTTTFLRFVFGDLAGALEAADSGAEFGDGAQSTYHLVWWTQLRALAVLGRFDTGSAGESTDAQRAIEDIADQVTQLEVWKSHSASNHAHRLDLVSAEIARLQSRESDAREHYERSITGARSQGFVHEAAVACELAARFERDLAESEAALAFAQRAARFYAEWGATAKVAQLEGSVRSAE